MQILNLLLECLVNETTNETAIVYSYASTKLNGTSAVMLNLPNAALGFVPWFCENESSDLGSKPTTKKDWLMKPINNLLSLGKLVLGLIITIGIAFVELIELIGDFIMEILMEWLPILEFILWLIIRVIILIFAWIIFALNLILVVILYTIITGFMLILKLTMNLNLKLRFNKITVSGDLDFTFEYNMDFEHFEFFHLYLPTIKVHINTSDYELEYFAGFLSMKFSIIRFSENLIEDLKNSSPTSSSLILPKSSDENSNTDDYDFWNGFGISMGILSSIVGVLTAVCTFIQKEEYQYFYTVGSLIIFGISLSIMITSFLLFPNDFSASLLIGMGCGFLFSGGLFIISGIFIKKNWDFMAKFIKFFGDELAYLKLGVLDLFFSFLTSALDTNNFFAKIFGVDGSSGYFMENKKLEKASISVFTGIFSLILAQQSLVFLGGRYDYIGSFYPNGRTKSKICFIFGGIGIVAGIICLVLASMKN